MRQQTSEIEEHRLKRLRPLMGTFVAFEASHREPTRVAEAIDSAFDAMTDLERSLHPDRAGSDLTAVRDAAVGTAVTVRPTTLRLLRLARDIWEKSNGIFDPCLPDAPGSMNDLLIDAEYVVPLRSVHLDLGGIAKGFAVDAAIETLLVHGCGAGLVNAGGDMRAFGPALQIVVDCGDVQLHRSLADGAIAVSQVGAVSRPPEHRGYYRRNGSAELPAQGAIVYARQAAVADALTKCLLLGDIATRDIALSAFDAQGEIW
jgi:thiamine biosynthesis lipoprotein